MLIPFSQIFKSYQKIVNKNMGNFFWETNEIITVIM